MSYDIKENGSKQISESAITGANDTSIFRGNKRPSSVRIEFYDRKRLAEQEDSPLSSLKMFSTLNKNTHSDNNALKYNDDDPCTEEHSTESFCEITG